MARLRRPCRLSVSWGRRCTGSVTHVSQRSQLARDCLPVRSCLLRGETTPGMPSANTPSSVTPRPAPFPELHPPTHTAASRALTWLAAHAAPSASTPKSKGEQVSSAWRTFYVIKSVHMSMHACVRVSVSMCVCTCECVMFVLMCAHLCVFMHVAVSLCVRMSVCLSPCLCVHVSVCICDCVCVCLSLCACAHIVRICVCVWSTCASWVQGGCRLPTDAPSTVLPSQAYSTITPVYGGGVGVPVRRRALAGGKGWEENPSPMEFMTRGYHIQCRAD